MNASADVAGDATLESQFRLEHIGDARYHRTLEPSWTNGTDRIFGGYTAALCLAACGLSSAHRGIFSAHVTFLESVFPGEFTCEVVAERMGRSLSAMRVVGTQGGRPALVVWAWFGVPDTASAAPMATAEASNGPDSAAALSWLRTHGGAFHGWLETRAIDYPRTPEAFANGDGGTLIDVWSRPGSGTLAPGLQSQLYDVLVADGHLSEGAIRSMGGALRQAISLDLHLQWAAAVAQPGWRRITATSPATSLGLTMCTGILQDADGKVCATASQQIWCRKSRSI